MKQKGGKTPRLLKSQIFFLKSQIFVVIRAQT